MKYVDTKCPICGKVSTIEMTDEQFEQYKNGDELIQNIFPEWNSGLREMLITGTCPKCWKKLFEFNED